MKLDPISKYAVKETEAPSQAFLQEPAACRETSRGSRSHSRPARVHPPRGASLQDFSRVARSRSRQEAAEAPPQNDGSLRRRQKLRHRLDLLDQSGRHHGRIGIAPEKSARRRALKNCIAVLRRSAASVIPPRTVRSHPKERDWKLDQSLEANLSPHPARARGRIFRLGTAARLRPRELPETAPVPPAGQAVPLHPGAIRAFLWKRNGERRGDPERNCKTGWERSTIALPPSFFSDATAARWPPWASCCASARPCCKRMREASSFLKSWTGGNAGSRSPRRRAA